ncbi:MAG TPA: HhH-GPD-type base excision DNA repair protein [Ilumatobacter sp.]|nr:HhH-GPD-type base excision DNA repair protein [Ilumatobacter sp.]
MRGDLWVTGDADADTLLNTDATALLVGMVLDQQVPLEWAFAGPATLWRRLGHLDVVRLAAMPEDELVAAACTKPAIHRWAAMMARRIHAVAQAVVADYGGRPECIWEDADDGADLKRRLLALPGFGNEKAMILVAVLAKRFGVRPPGWEAAAGPFADDQPRTVADANSADTLAQVREWKRAQRAAGRTKQDPTATTGG